MKKTYLVALSLIFSLGAYAQPEFTTANKTFDASIDYEAFFTNQNAQFSANAKGDNQTWDARSLVSSEATKIKYNGEVNKIGTNDYFYWGLSGADMKLEMYDKVVYYNVVPEGYHYAGKLWKIPQKSGPAIDLKQQFDTAQYSKCYDFPLTYNFNNTASNLYSKQYAIPVAGLQGKTGQVALDGYGTIKFKYDGYGTLLLPGELKLENVAKLTWTEEWYKDNSGDVDTIYTTTTEFHHESVASFVMRHEKINAVRYDISKPVAKGKNMDTTYYSIHWLDIENDAALSGVVPIEPTSVQENGESNSNINIFPNPANDILNISGIVASSGNYNITITNIIGKSVINLNNLNSNNGTINETIDVGDLEKGLYLIEVNSGSDRVIRKLTIQ